MASLYSVAEKCRLVLKTMPMQAIISQVIDAYAVVVKREWYENKNDGTAEIDGVFLHAFKNQNPILDSDQGSYYIECPSSYLRLPHESGINWVSYMKDTSCFVRISSPGIWANLKANVLGGRQTYFVEGSRLYFPKMTASTRGPLLLRMAIALDSVEARQELNIPPNIQSAIVDLVISKYVTPVKKDN